MGVCYTLDGSVLRFNFTGDVLFAAGADVLLAGLNEAAADPPPKHLLFDTIHSGNTRTTDELRIAATMIAKYRNALSGRCAILVATPVHFGLARMFGVFLESLGFHVRVIWEESALPDWFSSTDRTLVSSTTPEFEPTQTAGTT